MTRPEGESDAAPAPSEKSIRDVEPWPDAAPAIDALPAVQGALKQHDDAIERWLREEVTPIYSAVKTT